MIEEGYSLASTTQLDLGSDDLEITAPNLEFFAYIRSTNKPGDYRKV